MTDSPNRHQPPTRGVRRPSRRPGVRLAAAEIQLVALCLLAAGQSAASAAPAAAAPAGCSAVLAGAAVWPGTVSDRSGTQRVVSDAYDSFLDRRPACAPAEP